MTCKCSERNQSNEVDKITSRQEMVQEGLSVAAEHIQGSELRKGIQALSGFLEDINNRLLGWDPPFSI